MPVVVVNTEHEPLVRQDSREEIEPDTRSFLHKVLRCCCRFLLAVENITMGLFRIWCIFALFLSVYSLSNWNLRDPTLFLGNLEELSNSVVFRITALSILNLSPSDSIIVENIEPSNSENEHEASNLAPESLAKSDSSRSWASYFSNWSTGKQRTLRTRLVHSSVATAFVSSKQLKKPMLAPIVFLNESHVCQGQRVDLPKITTEQAKILLQDQDDFREIAGTTYSPTRLQAKRNGPWPFLKSFFPTEERYLPSIPFSQHLIPGKNRSLVKSVPWIAIAPYARCGYRQIVGNVQQAGFSGAMLYLPTKKASNGNESIDAYPDNLFWGGSSGKERIITGLLSQHTINVLKKYYMDREYAFFLMEPAKGAYMPRMLTLHGLCNYLIFMFVGIIGGGLLVTISIAVLLSIRNKVFFGQFDFLMILETEADLLSGTLFTVFELEVDTLGHRKPPTLDSIPFPERTLTEEDMCSNENDKPWSEGGIARVDKCAICLDDYSVGDVVRDLPCRHVFHSSCVDEWLTTCQRVCPCCKRDVLVSQDGTSIAMDEQGHEMTSNTEAATLLSRTRQRLRDFMNRYLPSNPTTASALTTSTPITSQSASDSTEATAIVALDHIS